MNYPAIIGLETLAACNAACGFCDYPASTRKGQRLADGVFESLVAGIASFPLDRVVGVNLSGTNEPLVDPRIFSRYRTLESCHPGVRSLLYTNGSLLTPARLEELLAVHRWERISISLNSVSDSEYETTMGLRLRQVTAALDRLHRLGSPSLASVVVLTRVSHGSGDDDFEQYCQKRWPLFTVKIRRLGRSIVRLGAEAGVPTGCSQWFKLHFLPDGKEKLCCIDTHGYHAKGAKLPEATLLTIYNSSWRLNLRETRVRSAAQLPCAGCDRIV